MGDKYSVKEEKCKDIVDLQKDGNSRWEKVLSGLRLGVVRFRNNEVVRDAARSAVVEKIKELIGK